MFHPAAVFIGLRYTRAKRRTHFISFISLTSMLGVALGVAALITVMSVMNGFQQELRSRILGMTAHATIVEQGGWLRDWQRFVTAAEQQPHVLGAAPFIRREAMVMHQGNVSGIVVNGILPDQEGKVSEVGNKMVAGSLETLRAGEYNIVLGKELAAALFATVGDKITVIAPQVNTTPAGVLPRQRRFTISGIFEIGMNEYDSALAVIHMDDAAALFRAPDGVSGVRLQLDDMFDAPAISREVILALNATGFDGNFGVISWTDYHRNFFAALRTEKVVMFVILTLIVAVAAFNIVSTLVMAVTDKRAEVAILRTIGMRRRGIMLVFIVQGLLLGTAGIILGLIGGICLALNAEAMVQYLEQALQTRFLDPNIYYISELPSQLDWNDVGSVTGMAFVLTLLATIYPAWHAAQTEPAEALRYE